MLLLLAHTTAILFFPDDTTVLSTLRRPGESCSVEIAFIKANSSCHRLMVRQGLS